MSSANPRSDMTTQPERPGAFTLADVEPGKLPIGKQPCCGDPTNLDGGAHPWVHVSEDGPGDVYRCPECGATDVD